MSSIAQDNRLRELERRQTELEARIEVLERVGVLVDSAEVLRRPNRPKKPHAEALEA